MDTFWISEPKRSDRQWGTFDADLIRTEICFDEIKDDIATTNMSFVLADGVTHSDPHCWVLIRPNAKPHGPITPVNRLALDLIDNPKSFCEHCMRGNVQAIRKLREIPVVAAAVNVALLAKFVAAVEGVGRARTAGGRHQAMSHLADAKKLLESLERTKLDARFADATDVLRGRLDAAVERNRELCNQTRDSDRVEFEQRLQRKLGLSKYPLDSTPVLVGAHTATLRPNRDVSVAVKLYAVGTTTPTETTVFLVPLWMWNWMAVHQRTGRSAAAATCMIATGIAAETMSLAAMLYDPFSPSGLATIAGAVQAADAALTAGV